MASGQAGEVGDRVQKPVAAESRQDPVPAPTQPHNMAGKIVPISHLLPRSSTLTTAQV